MGWSEQYWEDVKSELQQSAAEPEPIGEEENLDQPLASAPVDVSEKD
jgi:hypothetical protein